MGKSTRRFWVERLESRCLFAAFGPDSQGLESLDSLSTVSGGWQEGSAAIEISEMQGLRGAALEVSFDHKRLQVEPGDVRPGTAWGGKGLAVANVDNVEGKINIFVFSVRETERDQGSLVEIDFRRSDGDYDTDLPLIDVDSLRVNDSEVSLSDIDPTADHMITPQKSSKLSLQFNVAAEGERSIATDREADWTIASVAKIAEFGTLSDFSKTRDQVRPQLIRKEAIVVDPVIALKTQEICTPLALPLRLNDQAMNHLVLKDFVVQGPVQQIEGLDSYRDIFAAAVTDEDWPTTTKTVYAGGVLSNTSKRVVDFSLLPLPSRIPVVPIESIIVRTPDEAATAREVDDLLFTSEFCSV